MPNLRTDRLPGTATDLALPLARRDRRLVEDGASPAAPASGGVLALYDLVSGYSWPSQGVPTSGAALKDISERAADASFVLAGTGTLAYAGGGVDWSGVVNPGSRFVGPASIASSIWGGGSANQYFSVDMLVRLPTLANWVNSSYTRPVPLLTFVTAGQGFTAEADLLTIGMLNGGTLRAIRPTNGTAAFDTLNLTPASADYGSVVLLTYWRNASGQGFRLKSANGTVVATAASGQNNAVDFSAKQPQIGIGPAVWSNATTAGKSWRFYRAAFENLLISGRDPVAVADADWSRITGIRANPFT